MKTIVITGGIGSGKSEACRYLALRGIPVYDADSRTKSLYDTDPALLDAVEKAVCEEGGSIRDNEGRLARKKLASIIFSSPEKLAALESIVHPAVYRDFVAWRNEQNSELVIMESAIFLYKPMFHDLADELIIVDASLELRLARAMRRDNASEEDVRRRIQSLDADRYHLPDNVKVTILLNDGSLEQLHRRLDEFLQRIDL